MRQAWVLVTCALMLMACSREASFKADPAKRPAQAGTGEWVARVLVFSGQVGIQAANGFNFDASPELPLLRSDRLTVGDQSFAIVHLKSERLTRLESNQSMQVADLAGLDAPVTSQPIEQQLTGLLRSDEVADSNRIVGWHARMSAARTVPAQDEYKHKSELKEFEQPRAQAMATKGRAANGKAMRSFGPPPAATAVPAPPPPALKAESKARAAEKTRIKPRSSAKPRRSKVGRKISGQTRIHKNDELDDLLAGDRIKPPAKSGSAPPGAGVLSGLGVDSSSQGKGDGAKKPAEKAATGPALKLSVKAWTAQVGDKWAGAKPPKDIDRLVGSDRLKPCFEVLLEKKPEAKLAKIQLSVKGGVIVNLRMVGGGQAASCLRSRLLGKKLLPELADGRYRLEVRLR